MYGVSWNTGSLLKLHTEDNGCKRNGAQIRTQHTGKMLSTSQYGGVSKMYQVQGKVPASVKEYKK